MAEPRQRYNVEFKKEAVKYIQERRKTIPQLAEELSIPEGTLRKWVAKYREFPNEPFIGSGNLREDSKEAQRLQKQLDDLREENEILKNIHDLLGSQAMMKMDHSLFQWSEFLHTGRGPEQVR